MMKYGALVSKIFPICAIMVLGCSVSKSNIPSDDKMIEMFEQNLRCFHGLRALVENSSELEVVKMLSNNNISFQPRNFDQRHNPLWKSCFRKIHILEFNPWYENGILVSIRYRVSSSGVLMTGGQEKGYLYSKKIIEQNVYDNLDVFRPGARRSDEVTDYNDRLRKISPDWYIYYLVDY